MKSCNNKLSAIIFDMDGTLYDGQQLMKEYLLKAFEILVKYLHVTPKEAEHKFLERRDSLTKRFGYQVPISKTLVSLGIRINQWANYKDRNIQPQYFLKKDEELRLVLQNLKSSFKLGLATNNTRSQTQQILSAIDIQDLFNVILTIQDTQLIKPNPQIYSRIAKLLGVHPSKCLSVGDRLSVDLEPARQIGMKTLWVAGVADTKKMAQNLLRGEKL